MKHFVVNTKRMGRVVFTRTQENTILIKYPDQDEQQLLCSMGAHSGNLVIADEDYFQTACRNWLNQRNKHIKMREYTIKWNSPNQYQLP